jgi:hypothetical protein
MKLLHSILLRIAIATIACVLVGCSIAGPRTTFHSFEFHVNWDSPDVELLDYRYGTSSQHGTFPPAWALQSGSIAQNVGTSGDMIIGDFLYVKWKIKETGEIFKDTVDLRNRLPRNLYDHKIYFVIRGSQLFVYLVTPDRSPPGAPSNGLRIYGSRIVKTLYPN